MIFSYCQKCGLYITVPDEFAGGAGACPRCKISLQIPSPISEDSPHYVSGLRYISGPAGASIPEGLPAIAITALGPSLCYECPHCGEKYESLRAAGYRQGTCTKCGAVNTSVGKEAEFPRKYDTPEDGTKPIKLEGEFLLAQPSLDQTPSDSIIEGVIISDEAKSPDETIETSDEESQTPKPPASAAGLPSHAKWSYLLKGKPAGPVSTAELTRLQQSGKINPSTPVWQHGMDGWKPIDNFPQLIYRPPKPTNKSKAKSQPKLTQHQLSQYLMRHCQYIFWIFIVVVSLVVLMFVTRQTFADLGPETIPTVSITATFLILCTLIYGVIFVGINSKRMKILPPIVRIQGIGGTLGLVGCLVIASFFGFQKLQENEYTQTRTQWSIQRAKEVAHVFANSSAKNLRQSHKLVKWNEFQFNGEDLGKKYSETDSLTERNKIIAGVFLAFNEAMKPPPPKPTQELKDKPADIAATPKPVEDSKKSVPKKPETPILTNWELGSNPSSQTVVTGTNSANKNRFVFTFHVGMLIQLDIEKHQTKSGPHPK